MQKIIGKTFNGRYYSTMISMDERFLDAGKTADGHELYGVAGVVSDLNAIKIDGEPEEICLIIFNEDFKIVYAEDLPDFNVNHYDSDRNAQYLAERVAAFRKTIGKKVPA